MSSALQDISQNILWNIKCNLKMKMKSFTFEMLCLRCLISSGSSQADRLFIYFFSAPCSDKSPPTRSGQS